MGTFLAFCKTPCCVLRSDPSDKDLEILDATLTFNGGDLFSVRDFEGLVLASGERGVLTLRVSTPSGSLAVATADLGIGKPSAGSNLLGGAG
jgi:hypothetical protein